MASEHALHGIEVHAESVYVPQRSNPLVSQYFFAYHIEIANQGDCPATLVSRHWIITDAFGRVEEVKGIGVVGEQPRIEPGQCFQYNSACPLPTQFGTMRGFYYMMGDDGHPFAVRISPFELVVHGTLN
jgi:ApaG protein